MTFVITGAWRGEDPEWDVPMEESYDFVFTESGELRSIKQYCAMNGTQVCQRELYDGTDHSIDYLLADMPATVVEHVSSVLTEAQDEINA